MLRTRVRHRFATALVALNVTGAVIPHTTAAQSVTRILDYPESGSKRTAIEEVELEVGGHLSLNGFPEERL